MTERTRRYRSSTGCLVCKTRKVKCDENPNGCANCKRLQIQCPGNQMSPKDASQNWDSSSAVEKIFKSAGVTKRVLGSCRECRVTKSRCDKMRPKCGRCSKRDIICNYESRGRRAGSIRSPQPDDVEINHHMDGSSLSAKIRKPSNPVSRFQDRNSSAWLFSDSLPPDTPSLKLLIDCFFTHIHPLRCLSFIHRGTFVRAVDRQTLDEDFGDALVLIMCALSARYALRIIAPNESSGQRGVIAPGGSWAERSLAMALQRLGEPSVQNLMALVLLCEFAMRSGQNSLSFMLVGCCCRLAQLLRLDIEPSKDTISGLNTAGQTTEAESRRRLMWSCYILDVSVGSGVEKFLVGARFIPDIYLPRQSRDFDHQIESPTTKFAADDLVSGNLKTESLGIEAFFVQVMYLRQEVLKLIRHGDNQSPWLVGSEFLHLVHQLEMWRHNLPPHLAFNDLNTYIQTDQNQLSAFYIMHIAYNQCFCDLYRVVLPGYNFPITASFANAEQSFIAKIQEGCRQHARTISHMIKSGLQHGQKAFDDSLCYICAYESTKLQVIYVSTCAADQPQLWTEISEDIKTNIELLKQSPSPRSHALLFKPLSILLRKFGFQDLSIQLCEEINPQIPDQPSTSESNTAPPEQEYMHPFSTYRLAWNEISWPRGMANPTKSNKTPQTQQSPHPEDSVSTWQEGITQRDAIMDPTYLGDFDPDAMLTAEEYALMADGIQDYLTWDPFLLSGGDYMSGAP